MILLYSKSLYALYLNSGDFGTFFLVALALYSLFKFTFFKDSYLYLFLTFIFYAIIELFGVYIANNSTNSLWVTHPYSIIACLVPSIFYIKSLNIKSLNKYIWIIIFIFVFSCFYQIFNSLKNNTTLEGPLLFPLKNALIIFLGILFHSKLLKSPKVKSFKKEPSFWFNTGFIVINISNFILDPISVAVIPISDDIAFVVGIFKNLIDPITYTLWAIGVYKLSTQPFRPVASLWP
jgi:hypothetical protein